MTIEELKRALVEVKEICKSTNCKACPFHNVEEESGVPYCPLYEDEYGTTVDMPVNWEIDDWKEDSNATD